MLQAAAALFGTQRFHEVRMEDIAAAAGVGKGTLYRYFSDKEDLYLALLDRSSKQMHERLQKVHQIKATPRGRLKAIVACILEFFDEQPHLLSLIQRTEVTQGPTFSWQKIRDEMLRIVIDVLKAGKAQGEFFVQDPDLVALLLLAGMRGVIRFGKKPRPRDLAQRIVDIFLKGAVPSSLPLLPADRSLVASGLES
jgi:TetR/AcrR family fatty acid metabolism transcriptional regulator